MPTEAIAIIVILTLAIVVGAICEFKNRSKGQP